MSEFLEAAIGELKRADHLIYVSLKYTRTVDVIKNILERLILCFDSTFDYLVEYLSESKKIEELPQTRSKKVEILRNYFKDNEDRAAFPSGRRQRTDHRRICARS